MLEIAEIKLVLTPMNRATNDVIEHFGGKSANFMDTGGQATTQTMVRAFELVLENPRVTSILVNIYGGNLMSEFRD